MTRFDGNQWTLDALAEAEAPEGRVRVLLLHSIAFGNLKPIGAALTVHGPR